MKEYIEYAKNNFSGRTLEILLKQNIVLLIEGLHITSIIKMKLKKHTIK